ncbi:hypothetical protein GWI33_021232 [Rhynchophorus ferrugineus]|uniref:PiggyBac transposable element-derived protein domain-containing protein n=1 Tax=Rhynchophorus ferrugineus TaxID=354439 RepID=A0A834HSX9_RHYFE|nr:hypothetical protein GWI33_021232 [Rhynchophorus ferrugineus]
MSENMEMDIEGNSSSSNQESHNSSVSTVIEVRIAPNVNATGQNTRPKSVSSDHSEFDSSDDKDFFELWSSGSSSQDSWDEDGRADKMDVDEETAAKRKKKVAQSSEWEEMHEHVNSQELQDAIAEYPSEDSGGSWTNNENISTERLTPLCCFRLFVTDTVINLLVNETNKYARSKFIKPNYHKDFLTGWMDVTATEMLELIGLLIFIKIRNLTGVKYYWSCERDMVTPIAGYVMTETRFKRLMSFWRFGENSGDEFSKISNLLNLLNQNFSYIKSPAPVMYVGKSTVYLREHYAKQKKGDGPVRGHKMLRLVDNHLYTYKVTLVPPGRGADRSTPTRTALMKMLENYLDGGRIFVFDNLFISIEVARTMQKRNSHVIGPIRRKSRGTPEKFNALKFEENEIRGLENKGGVGIYKWKINDTQSRVLGTCRRRADQQDLDKKQEKTVSLSTTDFLKYYESRLELFELVEQYSVPDSPINSETTWYRRLASDLLTGVCVSNAYLYYKKFSNDKKCPYYKFQDHLWKQLVGFTWLLEGEASSEEG